MVPGAAGGIRALCELIDEYGDELEGDFTQFYGLDLAGVWRGELSPRRALVLAEQLSSNPWSRFRTAALGDPRFLGWTATTEAIAAVYDAVLDNSVVTAKASGGKSGQPEPYPRPEQKQTAQTVDVPSIDDFPIHLVMAMTSR